MVAKPEVTVPVKLLEANAEAARNAPALMATAFARDQRFLRAEFLKRIAPPRGPHKRPTQWQTARQRAWWFAVGRKNWKGRTGKLEKGWRTDSRATKAGGVFRYWNVVPYMTYVQGRYQQRMHKGTWANEQAAVRAFQPVAQRRIKEMWKTVTDPQSATRKGR